MQNSVAKRNTKGKLYIPHDDEEGCSTSAAALSPVLDCNGWPVKLTLDAGHFSWGPVDLRTECFPLPLNLPSLITKHVAGCPEVGFVEAAVQSALQDVRELQRPGLTHVPVDHLLCAVVREPNVRNAPGCCGVGGKVKIFRVAVKYMQRGPPNKRSAWQLKEVVFESTSKAAVQAWAGAVQTRITQIPGRPKRLLVIINPYGGAGAAREVWDKVHTEVLQPAGITCTVLETQRARHAVDVVHALTQQQLSTTDGIIAVGGDGLFHEIINGLLTLREGGDERAVQAAFVRIGHIPAGSTDAVCYSLHGNRGEITAALHIAFGDRTGLDAARVDTGNGKHCYAVTMAAYGYLGDLMRESEGLRWMGPLRYEVVGAKTLFQGKTYKATVHYLPADTQNADSKGVCRVGCDVCRKAREGGSSGNFMLSAATAVDRTDPTKWVHTTDDFVAIKLLLPTCRSNKSPKGVAPYNHLCDGKALLVLVRRCNQLQYAQFLFELSQVGACRGRFPFVDIVDVVAMRVEPQGEESSWNVDGELLDDTRVSVQVHAGLIDVFARGPDV